MSSASSLHSLVAAAGHDGFVRLCDISSGGFTHTLTGHRGPIWAVTWSLSAPYVLLSGGVDGQVQPVCYALPGLFAGLKVDLAAWDQPL